MITGWSYWTVLALAVPLFWLLPARMRLSFLTTVSFGYLLSLTPWGTLALLLWSLAFLVLAPRGPGPRRRWITPALVLGLLGYLMYWKYVPPLIAALGHSPAAHVAVPLGLSYFTFKLIHYAIEVGRGNITRHSPAAFLSYMFLFPIFTAGPIERYDHYLANIAPRPEGAFSEGLTRITHGLIKQFVLNGMIVVPQFGNYHDRALFLDALDSLAPYKVWAYLVLLLISMYLDFSAYSDIAIGSARLFGIRIMENFNWPLLAPNIAEFWKRWHMTLAGWCQAYVYLPTIGLTRNPWLAVYSTFVAMGLWHAGSLHWIGWGLYHATGVSVSLMWLRFRRRRGWVVADRGPLRLVSTVITVAFVAGAGALTLPHGVGSIGDSVAILRKLLFLP